MKLVRFGDKGSEKPGIIDGDGIVRNVHGFVPDWSGASLSDEFLSRVREVDAAGFPEVGDDIRLGPPIGNVGKVVGIGLNYRKHAAESGMQPPTDPIIFLKSPTAICGPNDNIVLPPNSVKTDWEVELAVVIGRDGKRISKEDALSYIAGFCVANDVSEREYQLERGAQWTKGKSADTFAPLGPWLVTRDEIADLSSLDLSLTLNGELMQSGESGDMIFNIAELISRVSHYMSWQAGDVMLTGTPPGVGMAMSPPRFLREGDSLALKINGLGEQRTKVVASNN